MQIVLKRVAVIKGLHANIGIRLNAVSGRKGIAETATNACSRTHQKIKCREKPIQKIKARHRKRARDEVVDLKRTQMATGS